MEDCVHSIPPPEIDTDANNNSMDDWDRPAHDLACYTCDFVANHRRQLNDHHQIHTVKEYPLLLFYWCIMNFCMISIWRVIWATLSIFQSIANLYSLKWSCYSCYRWCTVPCHPWWVLQWPLTWPQLWAPTYTEIKEKLIWRIKWKFYLLLFLVILIREAKK